ncbi:MAG: MlaE family lipid ABC transporter permease subunit [Gammaproteobacteria bacterium]|jgi:phospholipid/cholesterol/gamma-HCH transport system permease protein|nr:MlaE family lipid ABC transporter permease subunit [Gammaproteobacteria bacterium]
MNAALDCTVTPDDTLAVTLTGDWLLDAALPGIEPVTERLRQTPAPAAVSFDTTDLGAWDTGLIARLVSIRRSAEANNVPIDDSGLPEGARQLIELAFAVREREGARRKARDIGLFQGIGEKTLRVVGRSRDLLAFVGELMLSLGRLFRGKATYLRSDLVQYIQEAGAEALPIVSLISFLIGMIFAFVGVMQLQNFGAGIYTADLVAVAMVREMAPIMTAIIMAGRTGAAYAAQIGTMKVNEEVDALTTLGMDPVDFLVMPRVIALIIMLPMLTLYGSLMGILGGTFVGLSMLDVSLVQYITQTVNSVGLNSLLGGLFKSVVYGSLVAIAGCQQGLACGNSAMAVGESTTRAVVMGIVLIVVSASILTVIYINLGI